MTTILQRSGKALELYQLLINKKTTVEEFNAFGWLSIDEMTLDLLVLQARHPNSTRLSLSRCIGMAIRLPDDDFRAVMESLLRNKKHFTALLWNDITLRVLEKKYGVKFLSTMISLLKSDDKFLFYPNCIRWLFILGVIKDSSVQSTEISVYTEYITSLLDHQNMDIEQTIDELFDEAPYLKNKNLLAIARHGKVFAAIHASKNADKILAYIHKITGDTAYLPKTLQDIFLW